MGTVYYEVNSKRNKLDKPISKSNSFNKKYNNENIMCEEFDEGKLNESSKKGKKKIEKNGEINDFIKEKNDKKNNNKNGVKIFYDELLKQHNDIRTKFQCQPLKLNNELKIFAQKFADNFDIYKESNFLDVNYNNEKLGINYQIFKGDISGIYKICEDWINEKNYYKKDNDKKIDLTKYNSKTKHFMQIIWKKTKEVGFGVSQLNSDEKIFVAFYYPAGNIFNEFNENISIQNTM